MADLPLPFRRIAIRWVRQRALALGTAALLGVPVSLALLTEPEPSAGAPRPGVARSQTERPGSRILCQAPGPPPAEALPAGVAAARQRITELSAEPTDTLLALAGKGAREDRLVAMNLLWARGERARLEAMAQETGDRVLLAKLEALQNRAAQ